MADDDFSTREPAEPGALDSSSLDAIAGGQDILITKKIDKPSTTLFSASWMNDSTPEGGE